MKIYFDSSGRGIDKFGKYYQKIYQLIIDLGHENINELIQAEQSKKFRQKFYNGKHDEKIKHYKRTINKIKKADVVVLELSVHSLSMGFLLHKALESGTPVIALYHKGFEPHYIMGVENDKLQVLEYSDKDDLKELLKYALNYASDQQDTRFNFFISPKHQNYLDWISRNKRIPRSVYLRDLIESDMNSNEEFNNS
ncbi:MAG: hypothetical protein PVJ09_02230 [Candidatus Woesebacteria bacterium]|jgi:hypothetical protein